jgi:hypothetical protein
VQYLVQSAAPQTPFALHMRGALRANERCCDRQWQTDVKPQAITTKALQAIQAKPNQTSINMLKRPLKLTSLVLCMPYTSLAVKTKASSGNGAPSTEHERICAETGGDRKEFLCTENPLRLRREADGLPPKTGNQYETITGVTQRIDGSDSEKKAISEILERMDDYFLNEVLAIPAYEELRYRW